MQELMTYKKCAAQHFGLWMAEPNWFRQTVQAIRMGVLQPNVAGPDDSDVNHSYEDMFKIDAAGIAHVGIAGMMTKGSSSFGGTSTVQTRKILRDVTNDNKVRAILLHIDSPGGTTAGTAALADDVKAANLIKPVHVHVEDMAASAAYWVASQARRITADRSSLIGSIGAYADVVDTSGEFEKKGWKAYTISTGKYKGMLADGIEIGKDDLAEIQTIVNTINEHFLADIALGRSMSIEQVRNLADGRMHDAAKAQTLGLIDAVQTADATIAEITAIIDTETEARRAGQSRYAMADAMIRNSNG